jgi:tRNA A-37 threonylcarbamoyl transferase component Bud32
MAAIAVGLLAAALVHIAVGSPGGRPTASRIVLALRGLGVAVDDLAPASMHGEGVVLFRGNDDQGALAVKVYGRDAWDGQLLSSLWRRAWYRDTQRTARLSRIELVEHEGFVTLLAERAGVRVPRIVTAGSAGRGDALVVVRPDGTPLSGDVTADADAVASLWNDLARLHRAGITHRRLDLDRVVLRPDGSVGFGDLASASVADTTAALLQDQAQDDAVARPRPRRCGGVHLPGNHRAGPDQEVRQSQGRWLRVALQFRQRDGPLPRPVRQRQH